MDRHNDMIRKLSIERLEMRAGAVTRVPLAAGDCLTNRQGRLWITRSNDSHDYWLLPGDSLRFPCAGVLLLQAYGDSALTIEARQPAKLPALSNALRRLATGLRGWHMISPDETCRTCEK